MNMRFVVLVVLVVGIVLCGHGVDVSSPVSSSSMACLKREGIDFFVTRVWRSTGSADRNGPANLQNCASAGIAKCDGYLFPCVKCGHTQKQAEDTVSYLKENGARFGTIWVDIEAPNLWTSDKSVNRKVFQNLINGLKNRGANPGVYTSKSQWCQIMGCDFTAGSAYPLWYPHYDGRPSFSDFAPFGGWSSPYAKQYNGGSDICSINADLNWKP